jgi:hypothetical protein
MLDGTPQLPSRESTTHSLRGHRAL